MRQACDSRSCGGVAPEGQRRPRRCCRHIVGSQTTFDRAASTDTQSICCELELFALGKDRRRPPISRNPIERAQISHGVPRDIECRAGTTGRDAAIWAAVGVLPADLERGAGSRNGLIARVGGADQGRTGGEQCHQKQSGVFHCLDSCLENYFEVKGPKIGLIKASAKLARLCLQTSSCASRTVSCTGT